MGMSDKQIANNLKISYSTFRKYKKLNSALSEALCRGKEIADEAVENALYKRALGYNVVEKKAVKVKRTKFKDSGEKYTDEEVEMVEEQKHIPADVGAQKFWLINRKRKEWKDNPHKASIDDKTLKLKKEIANKEAW